ncbi:MAG: histidine triad nucleotide-binding protein [bacterium]|nr:histidine triad nucleotide-binding protein [bacterium]
MEGCLFCKLASGEIATDMVYSDDLVVAFRDAAPAAPAHVLVIPRRHIENILAANEADEALLGHMLTVASRIARQEGIAESGFRLVINCNEDGGQSIDHLHIHLLGGRKLRWPPG